MAIHTRQPLSESGAQHHPAAREMVLVRVVPEAQHPREARWRDAIVDRRCVGADLVADVAPGVRRHAMVEAQRCRQGIRGAPPDGLPPALRYWSEHLPAQRALNPSTVAALGSNCDQQGTYRPSGRTWCDALDLQ